MPENGTHTFVVLVIVEITHVVLLPPPTALQELATRLTSFSVLLWHGGGPSSPWSSFASALICEGVKRQHADFAPVDVAFEALPLLEGVPAFDLLIPDDAV